MANLEEQLSKIEINPQVEIEQIGEQKQFKASAERMIGAIIVAVFLILFTLIGMFHSVKISLMILFSIPLTIIGASWTMLAIGYHVSMPAMMGFMLLSGKRRLQGHNHTHSFMRFFIGKAIVCRTSLS